MTFSRLIIFFCLLLTSPLLSQVDTIAIQQASRKAPRKVRRDVVELTHYLTDKYADETSRTIAISTWISKNIAYDYRTFLKRGVTAPSTRRILNV